MGWKFNPNELTITEIPLKLQRLPSEFKNFRIVQISDFHFGSWFNKSALLHIIEVVNQLKPDLIAITGDFISYNPSIHAEFLIKALSQLRAEEGKVAVLGNHDYYSDPDIVRKILRNSDIRDLSNQVYTLQKKTSLLNFAGIDDHLVKKDNLDTVIRQIPDGTATILLAHEPDFADISAHTGKFDLQLSGHTHGGQIRLPFLGSIYLPPMGRKYPSGIYSINGMTLYTNRGLGASWLRVRYNCPPEISVFTLLAG